MIRLWLAPIVFAWLCLVARAAIPTGATILDPDVVWDPCLVEGIVVSPDGKQLAYVSRGALWVCGVHAGPPTKLADLPHTVSDFLSRSEYETEREKYADFVPHAGLRPLGPSEPELAKILSLRWTPSQDGLTYILWHRVKQNSMLSSYRVMHASTAGVVTQLADATRDMVPGSDSKIVFHIDREQRYVVTSNYGIPLIWDIAANKPRVTPFDFLLPSTTSDRYLGVEIDTRQLVVADKDFQIIKRFDVVLDHDRRCDLFWSPDERTAVCRSFRRNLEENTNYCTFFRVDLETGELNEPRKGLDADQFCFSGRGNEVTRIGVTGFLPKGYGNGTYGSYIEIFPDGNTAPREIVRFDDPGRKLSDWHRHSYPPVVSSTDRSLFVMALPRNINKTPGFHYHLIDHDGNKWPLTPDDQSHFYTPYLPLAFADNDKILIARDGSQLFSISVESIRTAEVPVDD